LNLAHRIVADLEENPSLALDAHGNVEEGLVVMADEDAHTVLRALVVLDRPAEDVWLRSILRQLANFDVYVIQLM
jgi:hypothetical protein